MVQEKVTSSSNFSLLAHEERNVAILKRAVMIPTKVHSDISYDTNIDVRTAYRERL